METDRVSADSFHLTPEQRQAVGFLTEYSKQMVLTAFHGNPTPASASSLMKDIFRVCDQVMAGCLRSGAQLPCEQGCDWCCYLRVTATPLEVLCVVDYLQFILNACELATVRKRITATDEITRGMDGHRRASVKKICPLVVDNLCLVYPVRPIACRIYHSLNPADCELSLEDDQRSLNIRLDISCMGIGICEGLADGLRAAGYQAPSLELIAGLRMAMDEPGLITRWLAGDPAFKDAE
jgi:hypothetical protein